MAVAQGVGLALGAVISVDVVVFEFARGSHACDYRRRHVAQTYESVLHDKSSFSFFLIFYHYNGNCTSVVSILC